MEGKIKITAQEVRDLRTKSGCPMSDCLVALQRSEGDPEKAFDLLKQERRRPWAIYD